MDRRRSSTPLPDPRAWKDVDELFAALVRERDALKKENEILRAGVRSVEATDIPTAPTEIAARNDGYSIAHLGPFTVVDEPCSEVTVTGFTRIVDAWQVTLAYCAGGDTARDIVRAIKAAEAR